MTDLHTASGLRGRKVLGVVGKTCRVRTYQSGRVCIVDGCCTRLSMYNPSPTCAVHTAIWRASLRKAQEAAPRREPETRRCAHEPCGREFVTTNPARKYCSDACRMRAFQARTVAARQLGSDGELHIAQAS
jgi:hypothetical protein